MNEHDGGVFRNGVDLFNRREFFTCHEVWEDLWRETQPPDRLFLQSLIHCAVGFHHYGNGNRIGASRQLQKGIRKMSGYLPEWYGIRTEMLTQEIRRCLAIIEAGGAVDDYPRI